MSTELIKLLKQYDDAYFNGNAIVSDIEYNQLKEKAFKASPTDPYFMQVGSDVREGKIDLPFIMGSLDQIDEGKITSWVSKYNLYDKSIVRSHKLDGVSVMLRYNNGELKIAYSRGNGVQGADITRHVKKLKSVPLKISTDKHLTVRGEIIMSNEKFKSWAEEFANPRQMVAGAMNRKVTEQSMLDDIDLIVYQIVDCDESIYTPTQEKDFKLLRSLGFSVVKYNKILGQYLNDPYLKSDLIQCKVDSDYELDGIVLTINEKESRKTLSNSSSLNPEHSVKYKVLPDSFKVTAQVVNVHYELSKHGFFKPRVEINPVSLFGTVVTFATGFNGRYIVENNLGPGSVIKITKGGSVIPDIIEVVQGTTPVFPTEPWHWNKTGTEFRVDNYDTHPEVIFKKVLQFFTTIEVDLLKEASLKSIIEHFELSNLSYEEIITTIVGLLEAEWIKVIGTNGSKIYNSLHRRLSSMKLETYLGAVEYFGFGFGKRKAKALIKSDKSVWDLSIDDIKNMDGFDTTAEAIFKGIPKAKALLESLPINLVVEEKSDELAGITVVFTGFRDKEFQDKLEKLGAKVTTSVSKNTSYVITIEPNSTSTKAKKARELGIGTLSLSEFKDMYNL